MVHYQRSVIGGDQCRIRKASDDESNEYRILITWRLWFEGNERPAPYDAIFDRGSVAAKDRVTFPRVVVTHLK